MTRTSNSDCSSHWMGPGATAHPTRPSGDGPCVHDEMPGARHANRGAASRALFGLMDTIDGLPTDSLAPALAQLAAAQTRIAARLASKAHETSPGETTDNLLTAREVADRLGLSLDAVYRKKDSWPFTLRIGRSVRFSERRLGRWLSKRARSLQ